jgi:aminocarboxymuconate-semialdehyde decarboxylase
MIIDTHAHIIVPEILRDAAPDEQWRPAVLWEHERQVIEFGGKQIRSAVREFVHIEQILAEQAKAGVDHTVLAPWVSLVRYDAPAAEGLSISRIQNDALAALAQQYPDHISALGTVPLQDPDLAARELEAIMRLDGMAGVQIAASVNGDYLGHERFRPFWAAAEAVNALVFIHPTTRGFDLPVLDEYYLWNTVGNPLETAITAAHMVMSGVMEQHPGLKVLLAHGGGVLLALRGRLRHSHTFQPQAKSRLVESPEQSLKRFYYDTLTHDTDLLRALIDFAGVDHVLVGSDYPFDMGDTRPADIVYSLNLDAASERKILHENAARLLGLDL